jgi:DNA-binding response OmpR family regulator
MSILVVDDEYHVRTLLMALLEDAGYDTDGAANGREAVNCLRQNPGRFRLVLLDAMMPLMSGWALLEVLGENAALAQIPVVLMTAAGDVRKKALECGAVDYLPKPIDVDRLLDIAEYYVDNRQETRERGGSSE